MSITAEPCVNGQVDDDTVAPFPNKHNKHNKNDKRLLRRRELGSTSSSKKSSSSSSSKKSSSKQSFLPVVNIDVGMGCGGVNVEYVLRDSQGVDETTLASILASGNLAKDVQVHGRHRTRAHSNIRISHTFTSRSYFLTPPIISFLSYSF